MSCSGRGDILNYFIHVIDTKVSADDMTLTLSLSSLPLKLTILTPISKESQLQKTSTKKPVQTRFGSLTSELLFPLRPFPTMVGF